MRASLMASLPLVLVVASACSHTPDPHPFADAAKWAPIFDDPSRADWQKPDAVVQSMGITIGMTVADIGAGTGYFERPLARAVGERGSVLALDDEPQMVFWIEQRADRGKLTNVHAGLVSPDDPELVTASVDRILIVDTWNYLHHRTAYARKLLAALKPGGSVMIVDFTAESKLGPPIDHRVTAQEVANEIVAGGFTSEIIDEALSEQFVVVGRKK